MTHFGREPTPLGISDEKPGSPSIGRYFGSARSRLACGGGDLSPWIAPLGNLGRNPQIITLNYLPKEQAAPSHHGQPMSCTVWFHHAGEVLLAHWRSGTSDRLVMYPRTAAMPTQRYTPDEGATRSGTYALGLWSSATTDRTDRQTRQGNHSAGRPGRRSASPGDRSAAGGPGGGGCWRGWWGLVPDALLQYRLRLHRPTAGLCDPRKRPVLLQSGYQGLVPFWRRVTDAVLAQPRGQIGRLVRANWTQLVDFRTYYARAEQLLGLSRVAPTPAELSSCAWPSTIVQLMAPRGSGAAALSGALRAID
jgi:hypothetical protein